MTVVSGIALAPAAATVRYVVACPWCGTTFAEFTCSLPVEGMVIAERRCHGRRCDRPVQPRVRVV